MTFLICVGLYIVCAVLAAYICTALNLDPFLIVAGFFGSALTLTVLTLVFGLHCLDVAGGAVVNTGKFLLSTLRERSTTAGRHARRMRRLKLDTEYEIAQENLLALKEVNLHRILNMEGKEVDRVLGNA